GVVFFFFFQAEDGIRDFHVTGVQTCALPIYSGSHHWVTDPAISGLPRREQFLRAEYAPNEVTARRAGAEVLKQHIRNIYATRIEIGRASCRERGESPESAASAESKTAKEANE